jgi:hypothetical protein
LIVPLDFRGYRPLPAVGYGMNGAFGVGPVYGDIALNAELDCGGRRKAERVEDGYITRSAQDACLF